jgi:hypothetical protein
VKIRNDNNTLTTEYLDLLWNANIAVHQQRAKTASACLAGLAWSDKGIIKAIQEVDKLKQDLLDLQRIRNMIPGNAQPDS